MTKFNLFRLITLALGCAALAMITPCIEAGVIKANGGTTFDLIPVEFAPNGQPTKFSHTVDGVVRVFELGNCTIHADVVAVPRPDGSFSLTGTFRITSADGATTLDAEVTGVVTVDPANPFFGNLHYDVKFTGGTGQMANVRGSGDIDGFGMFTSQTTGKATWLLEGNVATNRGDH
jgi:hypothetical protein